MKLEPNHSQAYQLLHDGSLAFARAERHGIRVDTEYIERKKLHLTRKIERTEGIFRKTKLYYHWDKVSNGKVNMHSDAQLAWFLYDVKKLKAVNLTKSGRGSTDEESLMMLGIPELEKLIQIRKWKKIRDTYLESFLREQVNGIVHPSYNLNLVKTYRSSCSDPNFQNIPKRDEEAKYITRKAFYPKPGHQLVEIDYKGIEVRIAAAYHQDPKMLKYINDPTTDMHADMAAQLFKIDDFNPCIPEHGYLRNATKNGFVFPQFYGDYFVNCAYSMAVTWGKLPIGKWSKGQGTDMPNGEKLSDHMIRVGLKDLKTFEQHVQRIETDFWKNRFRVYHKWKERWWKEYKTNGYVDLLTGFRCSGLMEKNQVINTPVQGAAFHCLLWSYVELDNILKEDHWKSKLIGQIHDALVLDVHPDEFSEVVKIARKIMCENLPKRWEWINVPLEIEVEAGGVDGSWAELEKVNF